MTKIVLSYVDYERVLQEGIDLDAYLQGRFDEAASDVKYLNNDADLAVPISLDGRRLGEVLANERAMTELDDVKTQALHAQMTADRALNQVTSLTHQVAAVDTFVLDSGLRVKVGDVFEFPDDRYAVVREFNKTTDPSRHTKVWWRREQVYEWMYDWEFDDATLIK